MINKDIIQAFIDVAKIKNLDRTNLNTIIEDLFMNLIEKKYGEEVDNFDVIVNMEKGEIEIYQEKVVVDEVKDDITEITLGDAKKVDSTLEIGDPYIEILNPNDFGRRLINSAKQFLSQSIRHIEKSAVFDDFNDKVNSIITASVHQIQRGQIFLTIEGAELMLPRFEQMDNDRYRRGDSIKCLIKSVEMTPKGPEIIVSRADNNFLKQLFQLEIPEIEDDIIEIKGVSRSPGDRSKVVVYSSDPRIDAVGACVGMRGSRIQSIVRELNGEKIDIINYSEQPEVLLTRSIAPAKPINMLLDENRPYAVIVFEDDELPIAIGRNGQNIQLASDVTGYEIHAISKSEYDGDDTASDGEITLESKISSINKITEKMREALLSEDIKTVSDFLDNKDKILGIKGFGEKTYIKIADLFKGLDK